MPKVALLASLPINILSINKSGSNLYFTTDKGLPTHDSRLIYTTSKACLYLLHLLYDGSNHILHNLSLLWRPPR